MSFLLSCIFFTQANLSSLVSYSFEKKLIDQTSDTLQIVIESSMAISRYENVYKEAFWVNGTPIKVVPRSQRVERRKTIVIDNIGYDIDGVFFIECRYEEGGGSDRRDVYFDFENKEMVFFRSNFISHTVR